MKPNEGRSRVIIEEVSPEVDGGRYAAKRVLGDTVAVTAAIFGDGHDHLGARLLYRREDEKTWRYAPFAELGNDLWKAEFTADTLGQWRFTIQAWVDHFDTWIHDLHKRIAAQGTADAAHATNLNEPLPGTSTPTSGTSTSSTASAALSTAAADVALAFRSGAILLDKASSRATGEDAKTLKSAAGRLRVIAERAPENGVRYDFPLDDATVALAMRYPDLSFMTTYSREVPLWVDRKRAEFSSWYEFFPRSLGKNGAHGTLREVAAYLPQVAAMGFDVVYMPPIHPIGHAFRKGKNNSTVAEPGDVGSPWAIGSADGGHKAILRELGNFADFDYLVQTAQGLGIDIALDIAFQCSPDHPWVKQHPDWFSIRPDGSIQYAENPPKKYQDIYPINFESSDWQALWQELYSVFAFWVDKGVRVFRVDNPHTKALPFWEWCIAEVHKTHPEVIFLAEAFTRPHVMYSLAKGGYTQSYTYFSWRNTKAELTEYLEEITQPPVSDFFRPNLWPNTPDILPKPLQVPNPALYSQRIILAATLGASYGVYGPAFELMEHEPAKPGAEEYLNSEKYQIRQWNLDDPAVKAKSLAPIYTVLNTLRREHPALQTNSTLRFHPISNDNLLCYSKRLGDDIVLCIVNLDPDAVQTGFTTLDVLALGVDSGAPYTVEDVLTGSTYMWQGARNYVSLDPAKQPAHLFILRRQTQAKQQDSEAGVPTAR
ncbi:alpha-1,4-glucan--maltose-1-phosphate maltosyltransferase [Terriglobus aquaticus]|uniref:Alpha-1,4-glucan:maltose-1-phosphate maltosyltransferase n=1 Tax=Terriglobus aquaticus TaxID=940139 RepID=A0ABW9KI00_9BACT|nr:alpha-1,4-glucan--maltose-1-phosphate maltosyltransferase [Terriglobus aquaticus]